jgi:hypothetical protein
MVTSEVMRLLINFKDDSMDLWRQQSTHGKTWQEAKELNCGKSFTMEKREGVMERNSSGFTLS